MKLDFFASQVMFPAAAAPAWSEYVERWYQLDAAAYSLAETYWRHRQSLRRPPAWLLLASARASNLTDVRFTEGPPSPATFVHTLPNIRSAALLQVMGWQGRVLCLQHDPNTVLVALREALMLTEDGEVWVAGIEPYASTPTSYSGYIFALGPERQRLAIAQNAARAKGSSHDTELLFWLNAEAQNAGKTDSNLFLAEGFEIHRTPCGVKEHS